MYVLMDNEYVREKLTSDFLFRGHTGKKSKS